MEKNNGLRNTVQRDIILQAVRELKNHPTADEVYKKISETHPRISRATVYRNLRFLAESGQISQIKLCTGADRFDHCCGNHCHIQCESCGKVYDIDAQVPHRCCFTQNLNGFEVHSCEVVFSGICPDCLAKAESKKN